MVQLISSTNKYDSYVIITCYIYKMSLTQDLARHLGGVPVASLLPFYNGGKVFFVDAFAGSDAARGDTTKKALKTVSQAYQLARNGKNDVIVNMSNTDDTDSTNDYTSRLSATLTWAKNRVHLVGAAAPTGISQRARIATASGQTTAIDPLVTVSGIGNIFMNIQFFNGIGAGVAANGVNVTGQRNYFYNCHIAGIGDGQNDVAGAYSLALTGGDENLFERCTIGLETTAKGSNANSELLFASAAERNVFRDCVVMTFAEAGTHQYVLAGASAIEGTTIFENVIFTNKQEGGSTDMTEAFSVNATQNGCFLLTGHTACDAGDWEATPTGHVRQMLTGSDPGVIVDVA